MIETFINENALIYVITIVMVLYSNLKRDWLIIFYHVTEMFYWYNYDNVLFLIGLLFEAYETYTPVLILFCVTKVLSSLCFLLVYKFSSQTQKTYITEVKLPQKEAFLEDKTVLTLTSGEKVPLLVEKLPRRYSDVISENMDTLLWGGWGYRSWVYWQSLWIMRLWKYRLLPVWMYTDNKRLLEIEVLS